MLKRLFQGKRQQPQARWGHSCVALKNKAIVWGGMQAVLPEVHTSDQKTHISSVIEIFDLRSGKWQQERTVGTPPLGIRGHACASVKNKIYYFGGFCGHDWCRHNTMHCLDTLTNVWRAVAPQNPAKSPMCKSRSGMVHFKIDGEDYLCVFGGTGLLSSANLTEAIYIPWRENPDWGWTNEVHFFALNNGEWSTPSVTGESPPPCAGFTLTKISHISALLYGGYNPQSGTCIKDCYIMQVTHDGIHWKKLDINQSEEGQRERKFPLGRQDHAAVCISSPMTGQNQTNLLILGGRDRGGNTLNDCWLLDVDNGKWTQIFLLESVAHRHFHSGITFQLKKDHVLVILFGGVREWLWGKLARQQPALSATVILDGVASPEGEWAFRVVMGETDPIPTNNYYQLMQQFFNEEEREDDEEEEMEHPPQLKLTFSTVGRDELDTSNNPLLPQSPIMVANKLVTTENEHSTNGIKPVQFSSIYEDFSSDMDLRGTNCDAIKELEKQLVIAQDRGEEIEEMFHQAVMNAEERAVKAEEKTRAAERTILVLEEQIKMLEIATKQSEEKVCEAYGEALDYSGRILQLEKQVLAFEDRAINADISLNEAQCQIEEKEKRLKIAEEKEKEMEEKVDELETLVMKMEQELLDTTARLMETKETLNEKQHFGDVMVSKEEEENSRETWLHDDLATSQLIYWRAITDLKHPNIILSLPDSDDHSLCAVKITTSQISTPHTLQKELYERKTLTRLEIAAISFDIAFTLVYLHQQQLRSLFHLQLDPSHILLEPKDPGDKVTKWKANILISLADKPPFVPEKGTHKESNSTPKSMHCSYSGGVQPNHFISDAYRFGLVLTVMAIGLQLPLDKDNIDDVIKSIDWPSLADIVSKCVNANNDDSFHIDDILHYVETIKM